MDLPGFVSDPPLPIVVTSAFRVRDQENVVCHSRPNLGLHNSTLKTLGALLKFDKRFAK